MVDWGWCSQVRTSSEPQFGALRESGGTRQAGSTVAESLVVLYRVGTHQIWRRWRAARSPTSRGRAEPLCARVTDLNREVSEGKADAWPRSFFFLRGPQGAANGQDSWGFFKDAQGFGRLDTGSRAGFTSSRPPPPWTSVFHFFYFCTVVVVVVVVVDSHIQRIVLATEETTVTQQVSHRPIKCQSRLWSQRGTKVNGSHHGDNPLLRPTGIQIATKSYASLQAMAPTNIKTVHQTSFLHIESNLDRLGMLSPTHDQRSQQKTGKITLQPVLINKSKILKATHCTEIRKNEIPRSMVVEALSWRSRRASQHPPVQSPVYP